MHVNQAKMKTRKRPSSSLILKGYIHRTQSCGRKIIISNVCCRYAYLDRCPVFRLMRPVDATLSFPIQTALLDIRASTLCFSEFTYSAMSYEGPSQISDDRKARCYQLTQHCTESFAMSVLQAVIVRILKTSTSLNSKSKIS